MSEDLLKVKNLKTYFYTENGVVPAVENLSFTLKKGETLGIVGESGCGKSITSLSIMGLVPNPPGKIIGGSIEFKGKDLLKLSEREFNAVRGKQIAMIFQEPMTSLNPVLTIGRQLTEVFETHEKMNKKEAFQKSIEMLKRVKIPSAEKRINEYPHQLSGGMRQRVMIAMALCLSPELLICDEPTTALDVTIQAQILDLIKDIKEQFNMSVIFITHDLGVVWEVATNVMVMYAGEMVEYADRKELFTNPLHPYTKGLMDALPDMDNEVSELKVIRGMVPSLTNKPKGCVFRERCDYSTSACESNAPPIQDFNGHLVRCCNVKMV